ncbi:MAG: hypothetical protein HY040_20170 [Planctomycetes bacterium]|nr:hypothetical protein [Planctomycetota bacterium]
MARYLAIDWEQQQLHIVAGSAGRKGARVEQVLTWALPQSLTPASAEGLGRKLREALKAAGIGAAPVLASIGRDRVILKEIHHPPVPASDEPALVRFQTAKELSESPDDVVIDYTPMTDDRVIVECVAMAVVVRKEILRSLQGLCKGAGLKLAAVAPRPMGMAGALDRMRRGTVPLGMIDAVASVGPRWADLAILRGQTVLLARALSVGPTLAGEIKRSLAVFAAQKELHAQAFFLAGNGENAALFQTLHETLGIPVHQLDAFSAEDASVPAKERGASLTGIGLLHLWGQAGKLPVNLAAPKEPKAPVNSRKRVGVLAAVAAAVMLIFGGVYANRVMAGKRAKVAELSGARTEVEAKLKALGQDRVDIDALKEWEQASIPWLDEFYDLSERFPHKVGLRVNQVLANPTAKKNTKDRNVGRIVLQVVGDPKDDALLYDFVGSLNRDPHLRAAMVHTKGEGKFQIFIDLAPQAADKKIARVAPVARPKAPKESEFNFDDGGAP